MMPERLSCFETDGWVEICQVYPVPLRQIPFLVDTDPDWYQTSNCFSWQFPFKKRILSLKILSENIVFTFRKDEFVLLCHG